MDVLGEGHPNHGSLEYQALSTSCELKIRGTFERSNIGLEHGQMCMLGLLFAQHYF